MRDAISSDEDDGDYGRKRRRMNPLEIEFPPSADTWQSVLDRLSTGPSYQPSLYNIILLHLGYALSSENQENKTRLLSILCECWKIVSRTIARPVEDFLPLLTQLLQLPSSHNSPIAVSCMEILLNFLQDDDYEADIASNESLLEAIVVHADRQEVALRILRLFANHKRGRLLYTVGLLLNPTRRREILNRETPEDGTMHKQLLRLGITLITTQEDCRYEAASQDGNQLFHRQVHGYDKHDVLLFLRLLSPSTEMATCISARQDVLRWLADNHESTTLSSIATFSNTRQKNILSLLLGMLVKEGVPLKQREAALPGVWAIQNRSKLSDQSSYSPQLLMRLEEIARNRTSSSNSRKLAAQLICKNVDKRPIGSQQILSLGHLLEKETDPETLESSLVVLVRLAKERDESIMKAPSLITAIAKTALCDYNEISYLSVDILHTLSQSKLNWNTLVRQPKVLKALVGSVHAVQERTRHLALRTLWNLSTFVANRRLLAKQTGLLSCWIRFVRTMTPSQEDQLQISRQEWKDRILDLARWL